MSENTEGQSKWTIQRNLQHKTKTDKTKTQHSMCLTPCKQTQTTLISGEYQSVINHDP
jgi:hypothetical protein